MTRNKKTKKSGRRGKTSGHCVNDYCRFEISDAPSTNATGVFVSAAYTLSTDLNGRWQALANIYQRWRIKKIIFHYTPNIGTTVNGRIGLCVDEDADGAAPTSMSTLCMTRISTESAGYRNARLVYKPKHEAWLWTKDLTLNEDRLEYVGHLYFGSAYFSAVYVPGVIWAEAWTEFDLPVDSTMALLKPGLEPGASNISEVSRDRDSMQPTTKTGRTELISECQGPPDEHTDPASPYGSKSQGNKGRRDMQSARTRNANSRTDSALLLRLLSALELLEARESDPTQEKPP